MPEGFDIHVGTVIPANRKPKVNSGDFYCIHHQLMEEKYVQKIDDGCFVCGVPMIGNVFDLEYPIGSGRWFQVKDMCGELLTDGTNTFYHNIDNVSGMGDCIQLTALFKYLKRRYPDCEIVYKKTGMKQGCAQIDPELYYPKGLVTFTSAQGDHTFRNAKRIPGWQNAAYNNWMWSGFLRDRGIYTDVQQRQSKQPIYDVVYCPVVSPMYNPDRGHSPSFVRELTKAIQEHYPRSVTVIDADKLKVVGEGRGIIASPKMDDTFKYILNSKVYIGGDTGMSHFAGAAKHKAMILLYAPNDIQGGNDDQRERQKWYARVYEEAGLLDKKYTYSSLPCCNPEQFTAIPLRSNAVPIETIMQEVEARLNGK